MQTLIKHTPRAWLVSCRVAITLALFATPSWSTHAYVLSGTYWADGEIEIVVDFNATNPPGANQPNIVSGGPSTAALESAYLDAMNIWSTTSTFNFTSTTIGAVIDPCASSINGVKFATTTCSGSFGSTTLAVQTTYYSPSTNLNSRTITVFNNNKQWDIYSGSYTGVAEFKRVAIHELGHALGLNHSTVSTIMNASIGNIETPQADDLAGAAALYDTDIDGIGYWTDNCPEDANAGQQDLDGDSIGDACDGDIDGDGIYDSASVDVRHGLDPLGGSTFSAGPNSGNSAFPYMAQSFTAGISGEVARVDLPMYCPTGDVLIEIRTASGGQPTSTVLASENFTNGSGLPTTFSGVYEFSFSTPATISSGSQYAIVLTVSSECAWFTASGYTGGTGYLSTNAIIWQSIGDFAFQTFITPIPPDNCPTDINPLQEDSNSNGIGDACELPDQDSDGIPDNSDNCPSLANPLQEDFDTDNLGDVCDPDDDNDTLSDDDEINIYGTDPMNTDTDGDGYSDDYEVSIGTDPTVANFIVPLPAWTVFALAGLIITTRYRKVKYTS